MERKIFVRIILLILILIGINLIWRSIFIVKGQKIEGVVWNAENLLVIQKEKNAEADYLVIIGDGYSLSVDSCGCVVNHDPFMSFTDVSGVINSTTIDVVFFYFPFGAGLENAGKELAEYINEQTDYEEVILIGHSKAAVCLANATQWIARSYKTLLVSAPYRGTKTVMRQDFTKNFHFWQIGIYNFIFSDHKVDQDMGLSSEFIQNANFSELEKYTYVNVISQCPLEPTNIIDRLLCYLDVVGDVKGDGIISVDSQQSPVDGVIQIYIEATHATSLIPSIEIAKEYIPELK